MAADPVMLVEVLLAELDAIHQRIQAADQRAAEAVTRATALRDVLRWDRDRRRTHGGDAE